MGVWQVLLKLRYVGMYQVLLKLWCVGMCLVLLKLRCVGLCQVLHQMSLVGICHSGVHGESDTDHYVDIVVVQMAGGTVAMDAY